MLVSYKGGGDGSQKGGLMALRCNPVQKANNLEEGFVGYLSSKSCMVDMS